VIGVVSFGNSTVAPVEALRVGEVNAQEGSESLVRRLQQ
jgi:hypothetical protein